MELNPEMCKVLHFGKSDSSCMYRVNCRNLKIMDVQKKPWGACPLFPKSGDTGG